MYELINETTRAEYEAFIQSHPQGHFCQSHMWGAQKTAWDFQAIAVRGADGAIVGGMGVLIRKAPLFPVSMLYICRGPVCDLDDHDTLSRLMEGVKALAKQHRGYIIKIDPPVSIENTAFRAELEHFGFKYFSNMLKNLGEHCRLYMAFLGDEAIAGTLAIWFGDKVWYLYGASANVHRETMPNYALQWEMIRWAVEKGCRIYDFRGVSGDLSEDNPLYGLYKFKKGFNSELVEFMGEYDLVISPMWNSLIKLATRCYRTMNEVRYKLKNRKD